MDCVNLVTSVSRLVLSDLGKQVVTELRFCRRDLWCCLPVIKKLIIFKWKFCYRSLIRGSECLCHLGQGCAQLPSCDSTVAWGLLFCLQQKQGARSCGAPSRGARRQGWPWRWGTGWLARRAGSQRMGAWTATALRESKQHSQPWFLNVSPWNWGTFLHETGC